MLMHACIVECEMSASEQNRRRKVLSIKKKVKILDSLSKGATQELHQKSMPESQIVRGDCGCHGIRELSLQGETIC